MHFIWKILCFKEFLHKIALFFKKLVFLEFWSIKPVSRSIEIAIKIFALILCVSIDRTYFSINQKLYREFFKTTVFSRVMSLSNYFKHLFSLYSIGQGYQSNFLLFSSEIFARFFSSKVGMTFLPFLLHLFSCFMH